MSRLITLLIIAALFGLIFRVSRNFDRSSSPGETAQDLVRDALTGVYFPKSEALSLTRGGETLFFQSLENRDKFLTSNR
ncbi:MAG: hypothetical protein LBP55_04390 [Candidatus Adiutrix sp.]|jgi:hypothetical protein|nr:hypothetical protein [Candidatus Adiutrix sp.]